MHPGSTQHEPPKPFVYYKIGCIRETSITIFYQRFFTSIIHPDRAERASIYTMNQDQNLKTRKPDLTGSTHN